VRENYKVQLPALYNLRQFGVYITYDCRFYDTYQLVRDNDDDDYMRGTDCSPPASSSPAFPSPLPFPFSFSEWWGVGVVVCP